MNSLGTLRDTLRTVGRFALSTGFPWSIAMILVLIRAISVVFEGVGIGMMLPILQLAGGGDPDELARDSELWAGLRDALSLVGLPLALEPLLGIAILAIFLRQGFQYASEVFRIRQTNKYVARVQTQVFGKILRAPLDHAEAVESGREVNNIVAESSRAAGSVFNCFGLVSLLFLLGFYIVFLGVLSVDMMIFIGCVMVVQSAILSVVLRKMRPTSVKLTNNNQVLTAYLVERIRAHRLVRLSGEEDKEISRISVLATNVQDRMADMQILVQRIPLVIQPFAAVTIAAFFLVGVNYLDVQFEVVLLFVGLLLRLIPVVQALSAYVNGMISASASMDVVMERVKDLRDERELSQGTLRFYGVRGEIRFEGVSFDYPGEDETPVAALRDVSVAIPAGQITALVGPSGAGKSTFVEMLPRLRDPTQGRLVVDGTPIQEFSLASLRERIAFVPQQPQMLSGTIAEHVCYGIEGASKEEIEAAVTMAAADDFVGELPRGLDTSIGEAGDRLSGGQRQRLDLARALLRGASLLILDEPASALDAESEERLREALDRVGKSGITVVIIAHGFGTVGGSDRIVVLRDGHVADVGTHAELMANDGWYRRAFEKQRDGLIGERRPRAAAT